MVIMTVTDRNIIVNTPKIVNTFYTLLAYSRCENAHKQGLS
mgnify:CR=1 FL=1